MIKKYLSFALTCLLLVTANSSLISAQNQIDKGASSIGKIKTDVLKRGTGENMRVKVNMLNGTKLQGYISQSGEESFTLTDSKTKQATSIAYSDVAQVKGSGLSRGAKIGIGIAVGAAVVVAVVAVSLFGIYCRNEGGC